MLPRLRTQRATLTASLLVLAGCTIGGANAIAPSESEVGDGDAISVSESPAIESGHDASEEMLQEPDVASDAGTEDAGDGCDGALCGELPDGCTSAQFEGHTYLFCHAQLTWDAARMSCGELQLDLAIIDSAAENTFVSSHLLASSWIGATDQATEGSFEWITPGAGATGEAVTFTSWAPAVPDNCGGLFGQQDCVRVSMDGTWDDSDCMGGCLEGTFASVCESY